MLEEILEKILDQLKEEGCIIDDAAGYSAEEIIRQYMDGGKNGWISAEEQPKESEYFMTCIYNKDAADYDFRKTWFAHKDDYDMDESEWRELYEYEEVNAWKPLPEPYRKE